MRHKHHIIPKHMGGTDSKNNLIELSVEEHSEAHRILFEKYGCWQDYVAWKGLSGIISKEDIIEKIQFESSKKGSLLAHTPEAIAKRKQTFVNIKHQQGSKNSQYGSKWCVLKEAKDLSERKRFRDIPEGWITTTEWKDDKKNKNSNCYGKHWYNDGNKNYYLYENDSLVINLIKGRLMAVN